MHEIISWLLDWLVGLGYWGIFLGLLVEVIPSELVLSYGGFMIAQGEITFIGAVIAGMVGGTLQQWIIYWIGYYGGRPFVQKYGKYILLHEKHIQIAEKWFDKYGSGVVFFARFIPVVRQAISIPAGLAKMSFGKFTFYTIVAMIPWSILFLYLGMTLGDNWRTIDEVAAPYINLIALVALVLIAGFVIYKLRKKNKGA
ncbi:MAG TPA: DedA family protein [Bacillales bacterium]|nr:DedA family protein [Bacillales bacterium]